MSLKLHTLDWIALSAPTFRRRLQDDFKGKRPDEGHVTVDERYYEIRGEYLVLATDNIRTMNIDYLFVSETPETVMPELNPHPHAG